MRCFKFPKSLCNHINGDLAKFWWGNSEFGSKMHWKAWKFLGASKEKGGLGFRDLNSFNVALWGSNVEEFG
ncbi:PREDICTED: reverse mRNAase [Prunus dulcis]|uniref:PREDICTED: reverse mRNAase n=1 Tax=Prunus dulcis TaxID=3755 RepID=A0A5E4FUW7_PRUDU|nr:PREDICTED: reverse mRNAase [Prunus dulcis]